MGRLTTHVLDTAHGVPGAGIKVELFSFENERRLVTTLVTNDDGRTDGPLLEGDSFRRGEWELVFDVGSYFQRLGVHTPNPPFLGQVSLRFGIAEDSHYHVPLLVSPWSYSTYRGS